MLAGQVKLGYGHHRCCSAARELGKIRLDLVFGVHRWGMSPLSVKIAIQNQNYQNYLTIIQRLLSWPSFSVLQGTYTLLSILVGSFLSILIRESVFFLNLFTMKVFQYWSFVPVSCLVLFQIPIFTNRLSSLTMNGMLLPPLSKYFMNRLIWSSFIQRSLIESPSVEPIKYLRLLSLRSISEAVYYFMNIH